jgi:sulfoacetaldehyde acetyltransferase
MDAMDIFRAGRHPLIPVVHEQGAAHMADGYARVSAAATAWCIGQNGPGISNCVTAIAAAYWAHSPVVIVTPETGTMGMGLGGFQEATSCRCSRSSPSTRPREQPQAHGRVHRALLRPRDAGNGPDAAQHPARLLLRRDHLRDRQAHARRARRRRREQPERRGRAAGRGEVPGHPGRRRRGAWATRSRSARRLAERLGAPVVNGYLRNDSFPASHPLWAARWATRAARPA